VPRQAIPPEYRNGVRDLRSIGNDSRNVRCPSAGM